MSENLLIVSDSERDADMLYAVRMLSREPVVFLQNGSRPIIVVSDPEAHRAKREAKHCRVVAKSGLEQRVRADGIKRPELRHLILWLLKDRGIRKVTVPSHFPLGLARELQEFGTKVRVKRGSFFPERDLKTSEEIKKISAALTMAEVGLAEALQTLKNSKVGKGRRLLYRNLPLTVERVRAIVSTTVLQAGGVVHQCLVSAGLQTCSPCESGHGVIRAGDPILISVIPRSQKTGYFGKITRTVVKGRASDALRRMYQAVEEAQDLAFSILKAGVISGKVHARLEDHFRGLGFRQSVPRRGLARGFTHETGSGLGLQAEEWLRLDSGTSHELQVGHVVTVKPGLYYPGIGGVCLEDVAEVRRRGARNLTRFEKHLEI